MHLFYRKIKCNKKKKLFLFFNMWIFILGFSTGKNYWKLKLSEQYCGMMLCNEINFVNRRIECQNLLNYLNDNLIGNFNWLLINWIKSGIVVVIIYNIYKVRIFMIYCSYFIAKWNIMKKILICKFLFFIYLGLKIDGKLKLIKQYCKIMLYYWRSFFYLWNRKSKLN